MTTRMKKSISKPYGNKGLKMLDSGKLHAVRYIWEEGLEIVQLKEKNIYRVKSGIAREDNSKQYLKSFLRGDSTGKQMVWWDDNYISQNLSYEQAADIITKMDNIFQKIMINEGFHSRTIHKDNSLGTEMYENDNKEELIEFIQRTWNTAHRIAYEYVLKKELPNSIFIEEFTPRNQQPEKIINPVFEYMIEGDKCTIDIPGGSGKSKCSFYISQIVCSKILKSPWKVLAISPNVSNTIQLCNEFSKFYKGQTGKRLMDLYVIGTANKSDYRLLESWANVYSVSSDKLPLIMEKAYESNRDCAFFVVNKSASEFLFLANELGINFKKFFTIVDEIHEYSNENGSPTMVNTLKCAAINPKNDHLFNKKLGLSATHINRPEHIVDISAVFNNDLDKFGPCVSIVTEIEARLFGWICEKQGVMIPIPTEEFFVDALATNSILEVELYGTIKQFNIVTFVGVEGIRLLSYNNKILVLVSRKIDVSRIIEVLRIHQQNGGIDKDFELIEGFAECGNICVNNFNKAKRAIMVATRWVGVGNDTYTCDCTLPLYNPESRAFARQFGMRGDRKDGDKVTTFALITPEENLEDNRFFEYLQMISNGEPVNIVSESRLREEGRRVIGGRSNITLIRPERPTPPTIFAKWEEIAKHIALQDYIDEKTGETLFSRIVYGFLIDQPEKIKELAKDFSNAQQMIDFIGENQNDIHSAGRYIQYKKVERPEWFESIIKNNSETKEECLQIALNASSINNIEQRILNRLYGFYKKKELRELVPHLWKRRIWDENIEEDDNYIYNILCTYKDIPEMRAKKTHKTLITRIQTNIIKYPKSYEKYKTMIAKVGNKKGSKRGSYKKDLAF